LYLTDLQKTYDELKKNLTKILRSFENWAPGMVGAAGHLCLQLISQPHLSCAWQLLAVMMALCSVRPICLLYGGKRLQHKFGEGNLTFFPHVCWPWIHIGSGCCSVSRLCFSSFRVVQREIVRCVRNCVRLVWCRVWRQFCYLHQISQPCKLL